MNFFFPLVAKTHFVKKKIVEPDVFHLTTKIFFWPSRVVYGDKLAQLYLDYLSSIYRLDLFGCT